MEGNPPFRGLNWASGIELALRVISVALCLSMIGVDAPRSKRRVRQSFNFFSRMSIGSNDFPRFIHRRTIIELPSLPALSSARPWRREFRTRTTVREESWRDLLIEIDRQIYPDGVGAEQAPNYTAFAIELFLVAAACSRKTRLACGHRKSAIGLGRALFVAHGHRFEGTADRRLGRLPRHRNDPSPRAEICSIDRLGGCWLRWPT